MNASLRSFLTVTTLCGAFLTAGSTLRGAEAGFISLFEGVHALQWKFCGTRQITLKQGVVDTVSPSGQGRGIFWYAGKKFADFTLKLEFKRDAIGDGHNSGIFLRFEDPGTNVVIPYQTGYDIEINKEDNTGTLTRYSKPLMSSSPEKAGQWNEMEITMVGPRVMVKINRQTTCDYEVATAPSGYIGLENWEGGPGVQFRNALLKEYPAQPLPAVQPRTVEEALLCFAWKWRSRNSEEFTAYFLPDGKVKRFKGEGSTLTWERTGPLEFTLKDGDLSTTLRFPDTTFRQFSGRGFRDNPQLSGERTIPLMPPAAILAGLKKPVSTAPAVATFTPAPVMPEAPLPEAPLPAATLVIPDGSDPFGGEQPAPAVTGPDGVEPGFTPLLNATHNAGWRHGGGGGITLAAGVATTVSKKPGDWGVCWYAQKPFGDFILKLEFKADTPQSRAGVMVRLGDPTKDLFGAVNEGFEIRIGDGKTGDIVSHDPAAAGTVLKEDAWNDLEITAVGTKYSVMLNGKVVNELTAPKAGRGYIGLQNAQGRGEMHFRNVRVMEFEAGK